MSGSSLRLAIAASEPPELPLCDSDTLVATLSALVRERRDGLELIGARTDAELRDARSGGFAIFFIELRRSDRTRALAGTADARDTEAAIGLRIASLLRPGDRFALFGIDHLMLLLPDVDSSGRAMLVATRLVQSLQEPFRSTDRTCRLRPAVGCALFPTHGSNTEALIAAADQASRAARAVDHGYRIAERGEASIDEATLVGELETALHSNQLEVWLQPQFDLRRRSFDAAEALIRWPREPGRRAISPIRVVELAEANGLMPALTWFVVNTVLRRSADFRRRGIDLHIAVNLSASMLSDSNLQSTVAQSLELWDVSPSALTLEVTESAMMADVEGSIATLHELKRLGTRLSLDDFGTGYSSFAYLRRMPLDELKIDQLFVRNLAARADGSIDPARAGDRRIVQSIVDIAHNFDLQTVAEGVEDEATLKVLEEFGCDVVQGYYTARPMSPDAFDRWLEAQVSERLLR